MLGATLSGCGAQQPDAAAIVNDTVIRDQDLQTVSDQLNAFAGGEQTITKGEVLTSLILAPYVFAEAKRVGKTVSPSGARQVIAKMPNPSPSTIAFIQMQLEARQLDQASKAVIVTALRKAKVTVNPRYGTYDPTQLGITATSPNWIKAGAPSPTK
jgi:hypothetical protein